MKKVFIVGLFLGLLVLGVFSFVFAADAPAAPAGGTSSGSPTPSVSNVVETCCDCKTVTPIPQTTEEGKAKCKAVVCSLQCVLFKVTDTDLSKVKLSELNDKAWEEIKNNPKKLNELAHRFNDKIDGLTNNGAGAFKISDDGKLNYLGKTLDLKSTELQHSQITLNKDSISIQVPKDGKISDTTLKDAGLVKIVDPSSLDSSTSGAKLVVGGKEFNLVKGEAVFKDGVLYAQPGSTLTTMQNGVLNKIEPLGKELGIYVNKLGPNGENYISYLGDGKSSMIRVQSVPGSAVYLETGPNGNDVHWISGGNSALYGDKSNIIQPSQTTYSYGDKNPAIGQAQRLLGIKDDNILGPTSTKRIAAFQLVEGLPVTGKLDPATQSKMFESLDGASYVSISESRIQMFKDSLGRTVLIPDAARDSLSRMASTAGAGGLTSMLGKAQEVIGMFKSGGSTAGSDGGSISSASQSADNLQSSMQSSSNKDLQTLSKLEGSSAPVGTSVTGRATTYADNGIDDPSGTVSVGDIKQSVLRDNNIPWVAVNTASTPFRPGDKLLIQSNGESVVAYAYDKLGAVSSDRIIDIPDNSVVASALGVKLGNSLDNVKVTKIGDLASLRSGGSTLIAAGPGATSTTVKS